MGSIRIHDVADGFLVVDQSAGIACQCLFQGAGGQQRRIEGVE
jgi:hypothetical protein